MAVRRRMKAGKFQKSLQENPVAKRIIHLFLSARFFSWPANFSATLAANELNASNHLKKLEEVFLRFDRQKP